MLVIKKIARKCLLICEHLFSPHGFKRYCKDSLIKNPIRILGKENISIGHRTYILDGLRMEAISRWNGANYCPNIVIGDDVNIGQNCHFTCANKLLIAEKVSIMPNVLITDIEHQYLNNKALFETGLDVGSVEVGECSVIGMGAKIIGNRGVKIGKNVIIGANTIVKCNIPDNSIAYGNPIIIRMRNAE